MRIEPILFAMAIGFGWKSVVLLAFLQGLRSTESEIRCIARETHYIRDRLDNIHDDVQANYDEMDGRSLILAISSEYTSSCHPARRS